MIIVDDVLSPVDFNNLQNLVLSTEFPWYWQSHVSLPPWCVITDPRAIETFGWNHQVYNLPHIDYNFPHKTVIFYLNDSDGPTWIFNEKFNGPEEPTKFTVGEKVDPKENRMILLDGLQYHTASNPINSDRRVILNVNYVENKR